jgi:hypothetical protein
MKAALFIAAAGLVVAQDLSGQPECAVSQITSPHWMFILWTPAN